MICKVIQVENCKLLQDFIYPQTPLTESWFSLLIEVLTIDYKMQLCPQLSCSLHLWLFEPRVTGTILRRLFLSLSGRTPTQLPFSKWCQGSHNPADVVCARQCHTQHGDRMTVLLQWGELVCHVLGVGDVDLVEIVHSRILKSWTMAWLLILTGGDRSGLKLCAI